MKKRKIDIFSITEKLIERGIDAVGKKLGISKKRSVRQKIRKKNIENQVSYIHDDLSKSEQKGIVSEYYKKGIMYSKSAERKADHINEIRQKQRIKELQALKIKTQNKEQTI